MLITEYIHILKQADIFQGFTHTQLELVAGLCYEKNYSEGETIFLENSQSDELFIITNGEVNILLDSQNTKSSSTGRLPVIIATLRPGQSFGEIALVDQGLRSATARATQNQTRLLIFPRDKLILLCDTYPSLGYRLMYNLAADLAMKIRNTDLQIRENIYYRREFKT